MCELQVLGAGIDHCIAGDLEQGGPLVGDLHLGLDVRHVRRLLVALSPLPPVAVSSSETDLCRAWLCFTMRSLHVLRSSSLVDIILE